MRAFSKCFAGYVYADSTAGQSALYRVGLTGIPIVNVNNNCASGSAALYLARQMIELGGRSVKEAQGAFVRFVRQRRRLYDQEGETIVISNIQQ
jgi:acetyl-CoA acetyltransferase